MAGSYPNVPGNRMVLDLDESSLHVITAGVRTPLDSVDLATVNDESSLGLGATTDVEQYLLAFPEHRDVSGLYLGFTQADPAEWIDVTVEGSENTVTGVDGDWVELFAASRVQDGTTLGDWGHVATGDYRRYIKPIVPMATGLRALRMLVTPKTPGTTSWELVAVHCYGDLSVDASSQRVTLWHPTLDQRMPGGHLDFGNVPLGSSSEKSFRVKNLSATQRADSVVVGVDALTDATPSVPPQMLLSYAGGAYGATVTIPSIAPGAVSGPVKMRRVTPTTAQTGPWAFRVNPMATTWAAVTG